MKRWYSTDDLLTKWDMQLFEFIELIRDGLLQPYIKDAEKEKKVKQQLTGDEIRYLIDRIGKIQNVPDTIINRLSTDTHLENYDEEAFENGSQLREFLEKLIFRAEDINNYENLTPTYKDTHEFFRNLIVKYIDPYKISLTTKDKSEQVFTFSQMGFKETAKTWRMFIEVLENKSHQYNVGKYDIDRIPENIRNYNNEVKNISLFSRKFVAFLNKQYSLSLPEDLNVFKNMNRRGVTRPGVYELIFRIADTDRNKINTSERLDKKKCPEIDEDFSESIRDLFEEANKAS